MLARTHVRTYVLVRTVARGQRPQVLYTMDGSQNLLARVHACVRASVRACVHTRVQTCVRKCVRAYMGAHACVRAHTRMIARTRVRTYVLVRTVARGQRAQVEFQAKKPFWLRCVASLPGTRRAIRV